MTMSCSTTPTATADLQAGDIDGKMLTVHYNRLDGNYEEADLWTWDAREQRSPSNGSVPVAKKDDYGVVFVVDPTQYGVESAPDRIGFIPRILQSWDHKDGGDRFWEPSLGPEIWLIQNDPKIYTVKPDTSPWIAKAFLDAPDHVTFVLSHAIDTHGLTAEGFEVWASGGKVIKATKVTPREVDHGKSRLIDVTLSEKLDPAVIDFQAVAPGYRASVILPRAILDSKDLYYTPEPLGAMYSKSKTVFRQFAPLAESVTVCLYNDYKGEAGRQEIGLKKSGHGIWQAEVDGDLAGKFYTLRVDSADGPGREFDDPYATNRTNNDGRARITDLRATDPPRFRETKRPAWGTSPVDAVIYEIHVRDFSISPDSGIQRKGQFLGFFEPGTSLAGAPDIATGVAHLKELGVTHVQLLPIQDCDNDETRPSYNWGYMTSFFNSPDGWLASEVRSDARIREFKQLVQALHDEGISVIMDVVYNHTGTQNTFDKVVPAYFHRVKDDGTYWNGSGTGNEFRSESPMGRKFIIDSCKYWVEEYNVDGFRFDLMGLVDIDTVKQLRDELHKIDKNLLVYGEPWTGGWSGLKHITDKNTVGGTGLAAFNDHFRNALKGEPDGNNPGYVQNGTRRKDVLKGIAGAIDDWAKQPYETINYATCHDNLTLWDKLHESSTAPEADRLQMQCLTWGVLSVSQGILFLHGGEEIVRTKGGNHNSYNADDKVNMIDWKRKQEFPEIFAFHKGMVQLRRDHPVFRLRNADEIRARLTVHDELRPVSDTIIFHLDGRGLEGETWQDCAVFINPSPGEREFTIPFDGEASVYVSGLDVSSDPTVKVSGKIKVPGRGMAVIGR